MPAIRIDNRDYEEIAVRRIRDTVSVAIASSVLPADAATETTLAQVRDAIKTQIDLESTIWTDDSGAYYVRRDLVNEGTGAITISWTTPDGSSATPGAGLKPLASADRDVTQDLYEVTGSGSGYSTGQLLARILILNVTPATPVITELWYNLSSGATIGAPSPADVALIGDSVTVAASALPSGAATAANQASANASLSNLDADLGASADAAATTDTGAFSVIALIKRSLQNWTTLLARVPSGLSLSSGRLLVDGSGVEQPTSVPVRMPATTSVASSASSVTLLAANSNRRGFSVANVSTAKLYMSFSGPATTANCFIEVPAGAFLLLDQQLMVGSAIYGIWTAANGSAQVTEYV